MKITIDSVIEALKAQAVPSETIIKIVNDLKVEAEAAVDPDKEPKGKRQFVVLLSDPENKIVDDHVAWVFQIEEGINPNAILARLQSVKTAFNAASPYRRRGPRGEINTVGKLIEGVGRKYYKGLPGITLIKTKTPVLVVKTNNLI